MDDAAIVLQHRATYWLRTCTPEETDEEMAETVDICIIMEAVKAATGVSFET